MASIPLNVESVDCNCGGKKPSRKYDWRNKIAVKAKYRLANDNSDKNITCVHSFHTKHACPSIDSAINF